MDAREKVAEALWRWNRPIHQHAWWATLHEDDREEFLGMADAAIQASPLADAAADIREYLDEVDETTSWFCIVDDIRLILDDYSPKEAGS